MINFLFIFLTILILPTLFFFLIRFRNRGHPANVFAIYWIGCILVSYIFYNVLPISFLGVAWILLQLFVFYMGNIIGRDVYQKFRSSKKINLQRSILINKNKIYLILIFCFFLGLSSNLILYNSFGYGFNYKYILNIMAEFTGKSYSDPFWRPPMLFTLLSSFTYIGIMFAGLVFAFPSCIKIKMVALAQFLPTFNNVLLSGKRNFLVIPLIFFAAAWFSTHLFIKRHSKIKTISLKNIIIFIVISILMMAFVFIIRVLREWGTDLIGLNEKYYLENLINVRDTLFASISNFSNWFAHNFGQKINLGFGKYGFRGPWSLLFSGERAHFQQGLYYSHSNVYTLFSSLIADFGFSGSTLILFIIAIIANYSYSAVRAGSINFIPILMAIYALIGYSYIDNIFLHTTTLFAWFLFFCYFIWARPITTYKYRYPEIAANQGIHV